MNGDFEWRLVRVVEPATQTIDALGGIARIGPWELLRPGKSGRVVARSGSIVWLVGTQLKLATRIGRGRRSEHGPPLLINRVKSDLKTHGRLAQIRYLPVNGIRLRTSRLDAAAAATGSGEHEQQQNPTKVVRATSECSSLVHVRDVHSNLLELVVVDYQSVVDGDDFGEREAA